MTRALIGLALLLDLTLGGRPSAGADTAALGARLRQAAASGDVGQVSALLHQGAAVNAPSAPRRVFAANEPTSSRTAYSDTPLTLAVLNGRVGVVRLLLQHGADFRTHAYGGMTPLLLAVDRDEPEIAGLLLARGADPNERGANGLTLLMTAALAGDPRTAKLLLAHGADINAVTRFQETALRLAKAQKHPAVWRLLQQAGAAR